LLAEQVLGWGAGENNVDVTSLPPIVVGGGHRHQGTQKAFGCASLEVIVPDQNHSELLLIKWLSVHPMVTQYYTPPKPVLLHKKNPVKRHRAAIETATPLLCLSLPLPAAVNKYGT